MSYKKIFLLSTILAFSVTSIVIAGGRPMGATLNGSSEVPGPGDADGSSMAHLRFNPGKEIVCVHLMVDNIETATAAHIHEAPVGVAGPVVVGLPTPDAGGNSSGCVELSREKILDIMHNPDEYYVNVHNAAYPGGAVRGQIGK